MFPNPNVTLSASTALLATIALSGFAAASAITPNNLVILRVGDGTAPLSAAAQPVFLDEYTITGTVVQSIALPTAASGSNKPLTNSGTATSEGFLTFSANGQYLVHTGYAAAPGTASVATTVNPGTNRVIARVDLAGNVDTSTAITDAFSGSNIRSATSDNGTQFWCAGGNSAIRYVAALGGSTTIQLNATPTNNRVVGIFGGQLYSTASSGTFQGVSAVGTGLPTSAGQSYTLLNGFPTAAGPSAYDFFFADASTLYVADDRTTGPGGIQKWTLVAGTWTLQYTLAPAVNVGCRGLTGRVNGGSTTLYATTTATPLNALVVVTDSGVGSPFTTLATAAANTALRGLRFIEVTLAPGTVAAGTDFLTTPDIGCSFKDFSTAPLSQGFFGTNSLGSASNAYGGLLGLKGGALTGTGIPAGTDTIIERLAAAPLVTCPSSASVPIVIRALNLVSTFDIYVTFPDPAPDDVARYRVEVCLSSNFAQSNGTMTIARSYTNGGTFSSSLPVAAKIVFTKTSGTGGVNSVTLDTGTVINFGSPGPGSPPTSWVYFAPFGATSPGGLVDHDCNGTATQAYGPSTNFYVGWREPGATCSAPGSPLVKEISDHDAVFAKHCFTPVDVFPGAVCTPICLGDGTSAPCPCGNNGGPGKGCQNPVYAGGAWLTCYGNAGASASSDSLVLTAHDITGPGLFIQANGLFGAVNFGDGHLCAGILIIRLGVVFPTGGTAAYPGGTTPNQIHVAGGPISPGATKHYQTWYRSFPSLCNSGNHNLTNGLTITWTP